MYVITGGGRDRQGRRWWWQPVRVAGTGRAFHGSSPGKSGKEVRPVQEITPKPLSSSPAVPSLTDMDRQRTPDALDQAASADARKMYASA